jgi:four helix bundle protein
VKDFHGLEVWKKAHQLTLDIYLATRSFPREEIYGLTSQIRRACVSIPTNIAEGCGRSGDAELARFCDIAMGSASEVEYLLLSSTDLGFLTKSVFEKLNNDLVVIKRMLTSFILKLKADR